MPRIEPASDNARRPLDTNTSAGSAQHREHHIARLRSETFDVAIIGAGINGAAIARDAAMRGLRVALIDKGDFASATSSHSSKLIHGGLRYLPQGQLRLVYKALRERERLRHLTAPHLVRPIRFLFPFYRGRSPGRVVVSIGLVLYDLLARMPKEERHRRLRIRAVRDLEPALRPERLTGGAVYFDGWGDDARLTLENVLDAAYHGTAVANYLAMEGFSRAGSRIGALAVQDIETGAAFEIHARMFVNAAGPWVDDIRRMDEPNSAVSVRLTKGVHIVVEASRMAVRNSLVLTDGGGRIVFVMPHGAYVLIGTTDTDFNGGHDRIAADASDISYLLGIVNESIPACRLRQEDVVYSFAGLRVLADSGKLRPSAVSREEAILDSPSSLLTVAGGKLTTHREIAEKIVNRLMKTLGRPAGRCPTIDIPLPGGRSIDGPAAQLDSLPPKIRAQLTARYGTRALIVAEIAAASPELARPLAPEAPAIGAEVVHAVRNEFARSLTDFIARRTAMIWHTPHAAVASAPAAARLMAIEFGWDRAREWAEIDAFKRFVALSPGNLLEADTAPRDDVAPHKRSGGNLG